MLPAYTSPCLSTPLRTLAEVRTELAARRQKARIAHANAPAWNRASTAARLDELNARIEFIDAELAR